MSILDYDINQLADYAVVYMFTGRVTCSCTIIHLSRTAPLSLAKILQMHVI